MMLPARQVSLELNQSVPRDAGVISRRVFLSALGGMGFDGSPWVTREAPVVSTARTVTEAVIARGL